MCELGAALGVASSGAASFCSHNIILASAVATEADTCKPLPVCSSVKFGCAHALETARCPLSEGCGLRQTGVCDRFINYTGRKSVWQQLLYDRGRFAVVRLLSALSVERRAISLLASF